MLHKNRSSTFMQTISRGHGWFSVSGKCDPHDRKPGIMLHSIINIKHIISL